MMNPAGSTNPYAAPTADLTPAARPLAGAELIRREHLARETSIRGLGTLFYLGGGLALLVVVSGLATMIISLLQGSAVTMGPTEIVIGVFYGAVGFASLIVGRGLRRLDGRKRVPAAVLCVFGLWAFPIGTLLNGYFMYLLLSQKGRTVFTEEYRRVIEQTPYIRHRTSPVLIGILVVLLAVLFGAAGMAWYALSTR